MHEQFRLSLPGPEIAVFFPIFVLDGSSLTPAGKVVHRIPLAKPGCVLTKIS
jgi:hypothetical protein